MSKKRPIESMQAVATEEPAPAPVLLPGTDLTDAIRDPLYHPEPKQITATISRNLLLAGRESDQTLAELLKKWAKDGVQVVRIED